MAITTDFSKFYSIADVMDPTGIIALDVVLGGGVTRGDMLEISSPSGVGKSTVVLTVVKNFLAKGKKCAYLDAEKGVKPGMLENMGLLKQASCKVGEPFLFLAPTTFVDVEDMLRSILDPSSGYSMIVIDSITAVMPSKLREKALEEIEIGLQARLQSAFLQKYKPCLRETGISMWLVNQMRADIDVKGGPASRNKPTEDSAGGNAMRFYPDVRLRMEAGQSLRREEVTVLGPKDVIYGNSAWIWAIKNRQERPEIKVPLPVLFGRGVSNIMTMRDLLTLSGVVTGGSGGFYTLKWPTGDVKIRGTDELLKWIRDNSEAVRVFLKDGGMMKLTKGDPAPPPS